MRDKNYIDFLCEKRALIIFESELYAKGCPNSFDEIDKLKEHSFDYLENLGYNATEKELIGKYNNKYDFKNGGK